MWSLFVLVALAVGCSGQGTLSIPPNCERASCMAYVQWTPVDNDNVQFELEATALGWVAVGVSADAMMGVNGIDDVFACQRDATNNIVYAQDTFNPENQTTRANTRDSDQNGFLLISSSFSGERISCTFIRSVLASNPDEDRNLTEAAFILLAFGDQRGGPDITLARHDGGSRRASDAQVTLTDAVPMPVGMLGIPPNCERASCMAYVQWTPVGSATVRFELEGEAEGWVAVGVSADRVMGVNGIDDVFACQRDSTNDTVYAEDTYNPQNQSPRGNTRDSDQSGFVQLSSSFSGGRISCSFVRSVLADNVAEDRNLNVAAYLLLAFGNARGGPDIALAAHNGASRRAADAQVTLTAGTLGIPPNCERASCMAYVQWTPVDSATVQFELEATTPGWVAVGVSADQVMGGDGIDDVFACQRDATNDIVYAQDTFNPENQTTRANTRDSDQRLFELISSSFTGGRISCSFIRSVLASNPDEDRNLNVAAFILLAFGDQRGGPDITLAAHNPASRRASPAQVTLTDGVIPMPVGMLGIPPNCERDSTCMAYAQWAPIGTASIRFELLTTAPGWVAVGVSADRVMGGDGIDDVFACQRDNTTDTVYARDTYNPQNQSPRGNTRDSNQNGFQLLGSTISAGRIMCSFVRSVLADNPAEDRNLNVAAYLLLAFGDARGGPDITLAAHNEASRRASAAQVTLTDGVPMPVGMFGIPEGCSRANCTVYAQWTLVSSSTLEFELEAVTPGWVAFGVSADQVMGGNGIDDVFACQRDNTTDTVFAQDTYNPQSPRGNIVDSDQAGFELISSSFTAGRIFCNFNRSVLANSLTEDRNLNEPSFLFLAFGDTRGGPIINFPGHNQASRQASASQVTLTDGVSPAAPMSPVGTFAIPAGCSRTTCRIFAQWNLISADTFEFQLEAAAAGWVAIGVSADAMMGVNGIDDVFACQRDGTTDAVYAEDTFNPTDQSTRANTRDSDQTGFQLTTGSFTNGRISCTFTRTFLGSNDAEDRDLSVPAFLLIASGGQRGGPNIALTVHGEREATAQPVDLRAGGNVVAGCGADPLIRVHGILMYLAWVWLVPTAYFFAASMRPAMPTGTWFQIHRALMLAAIVPSAIGFILIFVAFRNNSTPGLIPLGSDNPIGTTHYVFGIVIIFLQFLNPIISICRCKPGGKFRWIFNLIHGNIIGWGVILLALVNVSLGLWQYSGLAYGQTDNSRYYPFWIWIAFLIVYTFWDSFLFIYSKCIGPRLDKMWKKGEKEYEMKPTNADSSDDKEEPPKKMPSKDAPIRYGFMIFNILLLVVPGLIIMLLIAIGCI